MQQRGTCSSEGGGSLLASSLSGVSTRIGPVEGARLVLGLVRQASVGCAHLLRSSQALLDRVGMDGVLLVAGSAGIRFQISEAEGALLRQTAARGGRPSIPIPTDEMQALSLAARGGGQRARLACSSVAAAVHEALAGSFVEAARAVGHAAAAGRLLKRAVVVRQGGCRRRNDGYGKKGHAQEVREHRRMSALLPLPRTATGRPRATQPAAPGSRRPPCSAPLKQSDTHAVCDS